MEEYSLGPAYNGMFSPLARKVPILSLMASSAFFVSGNFKSFGFICRCLNGLPNFSSWPLGLWVCSGQLISSISNNLVYENSLNLVKKFITKAILMFSYLTDEERAQPVPIWSDIGKALDLCTASLPDPIEQEWQEEGCKLIYNTCEKYGAEETIQCLLKRMKSPPLLELYWFARANVTQVCKYIEPYLNSKDEDELTLAIKALVYFDHKDAWVQMECIIEGNCEVQFCDPIIWYFEDDLQNIGNERALRLLNDMESRDT